MASSYVFSPMAGGAEYQRGAGQTVTAAPGAAAAGGDWTRVRFPDGEEREVVIREMLAIAARCEKQFAWCIECGEEIVRHRPPAWLDQADEFDPWQHNESYDERGTDRDHEAAPRQGTVTVDPRGADRRTWAFA